MKRSLVLATAVGAVIAAAGCSALGKAAFANPVVSLRNVRVVGLGLNGGNLDVVLSVYNPNHFRLDASRMHYNVMIDADSLAHGVVENQFTVGETDSTPVHIPVTFTYKGLSAAGRSLMNSGAVNYKVNGDVLVAGGPGINVTIPFSQTGRYSTLGR